jgi:hypothetical protein
MVRNLLLPSLAVGLAIVASTAAAQSAHVHGEGRLNIAIDGKRIFMELDLPVRTSLVSSTRLAPMAKKQL